MPEIKAFRGTELHCRGWRQEAILRMLQNNIENAERPEELIIYGGTGRAARNWDCFHAIVKTLKELEDDETLLIQSGKPVGVFQTHSLAPRVLIANANLVPRWSTWEKFYELEKLGLIMYGQMTAGGWAYIGTQGIIQGTYETLAACARAHFPSGDLRGRLVITGGMGGMGGAQPLAVTMNGGVCIDIEVDERKIKKRVERKFCDMFIDDLEEALKIANDYLKEDKPVSIGLLGNCAEIEPLLVHRDVRPDVVTDQTPAHDALSYIPKELDVKDAEKLRVNDPEKYSALSYRSMAAHVKAMLKWQEKGAAVFEYGNNIRAQAYQAGVKKAFDFKGFIPLYIRPMFCEGRGPFRWVALSGEKEDIYKTDEVVIRLFPKNKYLVNWIKLAEEKVPFEGLPARVCWLGYGERARFGLEINRLVGSEKLAAPVTITRDHLDCGSVASPYRETENMIDGSDTIADWPLLNALLNCAAGADLIAIHNGGGVGIGYSTHAGMIVVADGTEAGAERIKRVLTTDPGLGIVRHADAGYKTAIEMAKKHRIKMPMAKKPNTGDR